MVVSRERNARIHVAAAVLALIASLMLRISWFEFALIIAMIALVFFAEIVNTAIERTLDTMAKGVNNQIVKVVKDMTAGGVLVTAIAAVIVAACVFIPAILKALGQ